MIEVYEPLEVKGIDIEDCVGKYILYRASPGDGYCAATDRYNAERRILWGKVKGFSPSKKYVEIFGDRYCNWYRHGQIEVLEVLGGLL